MQSGKSPSSPFSTPSMQTTLRIGALLAIIGVIIFVISWVIHPSREDPGDWSRTIQEYAESESWIDIHLAQFLGLLLVFLSIALLSESLRVQHSGTIISSLASLAFVMSIASIAVFAILQAVDGISLKAMVDAWANAPPEEKSVAFRVAESIRWVEVGINSIARFVQAVTAFLIGGAIALTFRTDKPYPKARLLGIVAIVAGTGLVLRGMAVAYTGFSLSNPLYSETLHFLTLFLLWMVVIGVIMWKRAAV
ncbi:MAG TPA: hypothetical protein VFZ67_12600 [Nitrososphaera sp.]